jgi:hypothetical protein
MVLIMTVEPGFGGQSFLDLCLPKIARTRAMLDKLGGDIWLQIDGGVSQGPLSGAPQPACSPTGQLGNDSSTFMAMARPSARLVAVNADRSCW